MNALVRKEIRLLLPSWGAALALAIVPAWFVSDDGLVCFAFALASMLPSIALFGQEFGAGTFSILLSQPIDRRRIWRLKVGVLALALAGLLFAQMVSLALRVDTVAKPSSFWQIPIICGFLGFAQCSGALWSTLLFRQMAAAFWLTIVAPVLFVFATLAALSRFIPWHESYGYVGLGCYSIAGYFWAEIFSCAGRTCNGRAAPSSLQHG
jgi:ABC-type transport system involved in multi-copper enzyme maturation permease subunit